MHVFNSLAPVFLIIAIGAFLLKVNFFSKEYLNGLNRLAYWVGLPCFLFYKIATANFSGDKASHIFLLVIFGMAGTLIIGYTVAWLLRVPAKSVGTFVQASFRSNMAFIGLPVIIYTSSDLFGADANSMEMLGILVIAPMAPIYNSLSVFVLLVCHHQLKRHLLKKLVKPIATNPLLIACIAGILFAFSGFSLPIALSRTLKVVGEMSLPLALISIGSSLISVELRGSFVYAMAASVIKVVLAPLIGLYAATLLNISPDETRIALIYLACPTAVVSCVLTDQIGGDNALAAGAVVISTILAMLSLGLVVGFI